MLPAHFFRESLLKGVEIERRAADPRACVREAHFFRESLHKGVEIERREADPRACVREEGYVLAHEGDCSGGRHVPGERRWRGWAVNWPAQHVSRSTYETGPPLLLPSCMQNETAFLACSSAAAPSSGGSATAHDATVSGRAPCACKSHSPLGAVPAGEN